MFELRLLGLRLLNTPRSEHEKLTFLDLPRPRDGQRIDEVNPTWSFEIGEFDITKIKQRASRVVCIHGFSEDYAGQHCFP